LTIQRAQLKLRSPRLQAQFLLHQSEFVWLILTFAIDLSRKQNSHLFRNPKITKTPITSLPPPTRNEFFNHKSDVLLEVIIFLFRMKNGQRELSKSSSCIKMKNNGQFTTRNEKAAVASSSFAEI